MINFTDQHINELSSQGYVFIPNFFAEQTVSDFKKIFDDLKSNVSKTDKQIGTVDFFTDIYNSNSDKTVWKLREYMQKTEVGKNIISDIEKQIKKIDPKLEFFRDKFINQETNYQGHLPHQDFSATSHRQFAKQLFSVYVSLTKTTRDAGCLWVEKVKRTENMGMCETGCAQGYRCLCINQNIFPHQIENYKGHKLEPVECEPGDAIILDGWNLHGAGTNVAPTARQTVVFVYGEKLDSEKSLNEKWRESRNLLT